jgi:hypothetical protein
MIGAPRRFGAVQPPPKKPVGVLTGLLLAGAGVVVAGYMLDFHGHSCCRCGRRWRHFGAFNLGDEESHRCSCGEVQWWKDGVPHVLRGSQFVVPPSSETRPSIATLPGPATPSVFAPPASPVFVASVGAPRSAVMAPPPAPSRVPMFALQPRRALR